MADTVVLKERSISLEQAYIWQNTPPSADQKLFHDSLSGFEINTDVNLTLASFYR